MHAQRGNVRAVAGARRKKNTSSKSCGRSDTPVCGSKMRTPPTRAAAVAAIKDIKEAMLRCVASVPPRSCCRWVGPMIFSPRLNGDFAFFLVLIGKGAGVCK